MTTTVISKLAAIGGSGKDQGQQCRKRKAIRFHARRFVGNGNEPDEEGGGT